MTHLIVLQYDSTFFYRSIQKPVEDILSDFQLGGGRLLQYGITPVTTEIDTENFGAYCWRDWVIAMPVENKCRNRSTIMANKRLTRRQLDVLRCLSEGMTGKQIANLLRIHTRSVSLHISALKRNLNANTTAECVQKAARLGLLKPGG